jgi:hypothetical protein
MKVGRPRRPGGQAPVRLQLSLTRKNVRGQRYEGVNDGVIAIRGRSMKGL